LITGRGVVNKARLELITPHKTRIIDEGPGD
jgi:hypothetical protein